LVGYFNGTVNFGGGNLVSAGSTDVFVAKFNAAGVHLWSQRFGSTGQEGGDSVALDALGDVFVAGYFFGTVDFGGGNLVSAGDTDIFVAKYNSDGAHKWSQRFGSTGSEVGFSAAVDASDNVFVTGFFNGTVNFGGGNLVSAGSDDIFLAKYNEVGVHQWSQRFGSATSDAGRCVAVDASGNVLVTGNFTGTVNFGGGNLVSLGSNEIFVAKYGAAGAHLWSQRFGGTGSDQASSVRVDVPGNVFVAGSFQGTADLGGDDLVSAGSNDIFIAMYDAAGVHQWSHGFGGPSTDDA
jgi:hypothetical protein